MHIHWQSFTAKTLVQIWTFLHSITTAGAPILWPSLIDQTSPSAALDVLHHQLPLRAGDAIHPALRREWSGQRD